MNAPSRHATSAVLSLALLAGALTASVAAAAGPRCDSTTNLTLVGVDTHARRALFAPPVNAGEPGWLIELDVAAGKALAWPEAEPGARFSGSSGPGPVLVAHRCGERCLQIRQFADGAWKPLGGNLPGSPTRTVHATWDREGAPWVLLHEAAKGTARVSVEAYRLENGKWVDKGGLIVHGVGTPGALPAPPGESGVVSGDGQFTADGHPHGWLEAAPPSILGGELLWLGGTRAAAIGSDSQLALTEDGKTWSTVKWLPWARGEGDLSWKVGRDYWLELPDGERAPPLAVVWTDSRVPSKARLYVAHAESRGAWSVDADTPQGILTSGGERLPYNNLLRFDGEHWVLLCGCVSRGDGSALVLRALAGGKLQDPEVLPLQAGGQ